MKKLLAITVVMLGLPVFAQDVLVTNPKTVKLKLENARVRVLEANLPPGAKEKMHSHPSSIIYVVAGGKYRSHTPDGKSAEATLKDGDVVYRDALTHWAENTGTTTLHLIVVELKR